jgi:ATP-binding cassette subfamily F protein 3
LDLEMRDALNFALQGFTGAMVLVSHDRTLLASVCEDFYLVDAGEVAVFSGDLDDYTQWVLNETKKERQADNAKQSAPNEANSSNTTAVDRKTQKRLEAEFRKATAALRKQITQSEQAMERAQAKLTQIEAALSDPSVYEDSQKAQLKTLLSEQASSTQAHDSAEETWCEAQEALEEAQTEFDEQFA